MESASLPSSSSNPSLHVGAAGREDRLVVRGLTSLALFALDTTGKAIWILIWYSFFAPLFDHMRK